MPALIGLGIKSICSQFVSLSRTLHLRSPSLYQVLILASGIVISASGMVEILADFLEILSDILINLDYWAALRSQLDWRLNFHHGNFTRKILSVKLKYTGNGNWFGVCAHFPGKILARQFRSIRSDEFVQFEFSRYLNCQQSLMICLSYRFWYIC